MKKSWFLEDIRERNKEFPYTFYVPSEQVLNMLKVRDLVKVMFRCYETHEDGFSGERMWIEITEINDSKLEGILTNAPYRLNDISVGDKIYFHKNNIMDTQIDDPDSPMWDFYFDTKVLVSHDVMEKRELNFMFRNTDEISGDVDSGWTVYSGYESEDFNNDIKNFQFISLGVILNIDDSILSFINDGPLCAYERNNKGVFNKIEDYFIEEE